MESGSQEVYTNSMKSESYEIRKLGSQEDMKSGSQEVYTYSMNQEVRSHGVTKSGSQEVKDL